MSDESSPLFDELRDAVRNAYRRARGWFKYGDFASLSEKINAAEAAYNRKCQLVNQLTDEAVKARQPNLGPYWKDVADELRDRVAELEGILDHDTKIAESIVAKADARIAALESHTMDAEHLAMFFHSTYEDLAPNYGYKTRVASAVPWGNVPEANRRLMVEVASRALAELKLA